MSENLLIAPHPNPYQREKTEGARGVYFPFPPLVAYAKAIATEYGGVRRKVKWQGGGII